MKLKESQELQFKLKIYIIFFCFYSLHTYSQTKPKKLNFGISSGVNHNDVHLGADKITDRIFSNSKSKPTYNIGGLISYKFEEMLAIEVGAFYAEQQMYLNKFFVQRGNGNYYYANDTNLYSVEGQVNFVDGKIKATSVIIPARLKIILNPSKSVKTSIILGLHRQQNYSYNEYGKFDTELINIEKFYPNISKEVIDYLEKRFIESATIIQEIHSKSQKSNNIGFLLGINLDMKSFTIEINKHFNEIRPNNDPVYNYNFSSFNLRYWF